MSIYYCHLLFLLRIFLKIYLRKNTPVNGYKSVVFMIQRKQYKPSSLNSKPLKLTILKKHVSPNKIMSVQNLENTKNRNSILFFLTDFLKKKALVIVELHAYFGHFLWEKLYFRILYRYACILISTYNQSNRYQFQDHSSQRLKLLSFCC